MGPIAVGAALAGVLADLVGIRLSLLTCALVLLAWGVHALVDRIPDVDGERIPDPERPPAPPA